MAHSQRYVVDHTVSQNPKSIKGLMFSQIEMISITIDPEQGAYVTASLVSPIWQYQRYI